ncbi:MAG TPA: hypothetical protein VNE83_05115 [Terriglobales bacterium]|nr:hypothetical protein [Terriglobales bacterium]
MLAAADMRLALAKLLLAFAVLAVAWLAFISHRLSPEWLWLPGVLLVAAFLGHDRVLNARARAQRTVAFYERGRARLEHRWMGHGAAGERFRDPAHPYTDDLDIFGAGSVFELLCTARTPMGEECLAAWLRAPAPPAEIGRRQRQVSALSNDERAGREGLDLRQDIASLGDELKLKLDPARLRAWAAAPSSGLGGGGRAAYAALSVASLASLGYAFAAGPWAPFLVVVIVQAGLVYGQRRRSASVLSGFGANREGLNLFAGVLARIPAPRPAPAAASPMEAAWRRHEQSGATSGSAARATPIEARPQATSGSDPAKSGESQNGEAALRRLARLADWIDAADSLLGHILDVTVGYSLNLAGAAEAWRRRWGAAVGTWLDEVGEFEALLALASYAFEHPRDPFPAVAAAPAPEYRGEDLGHPLLADPVRNSVSLGAATDAAGGAAARLWMVSGSNMSGKSTLLRTVGVNAVLAQMGAPVRARSLRLTPLAVGTRLRTQDSLQQGRSGFYAEILRLRQVFDLTNGPLPVLYLFDELLEGTNSHDRVRGAGALLEAFLRRPALGLVTTHDLALAALAGELGAGVRNVHFEDQITGNDVRFDHQLRDGVVTKSNALALMRIVGLEV